MFSALFYVEKAALLAERFFLVFLIDFFDI
jgi:hypothetical protein